MRRPTTAIPWAALLLTLTAAAQVGPRLSYQSTGALNAELRALVAASPRGDVVVVGESLGGREILAVEIGRPNVVAPLPANASGAERRNHGRRPALLIVGGLEGDRLLGTAVAAYLARRLLDPHDGELGRLLDEYDVYVVPRVNPDGADRTLGSPRHHHPGNGRRVDMDRDGRMDEDGPDDLDGDGLILQMRVEDRREGTLVADPDHPGRLRERDRSRGEQGVYVLHVEGHDDDGDGDLNEDGAGGVDVARNFPHAFAEHDLLSGRYMVSEPETRALADYVLARRNIACVLVYGASDNLVKTPEKGGAGRSITKLTPDDHALVSEVGERFRELVGSHGSDAGSKTGTFHDWAYFHRGLPSFAANLFQVSETRPDDEDESTEDPVAVHLRERRETGFVAWRGLDHASLGRVEIGGWMPGARTQPDTNIAAIVAERQVRFVTELLARIARVDVDGLAARRLADGLYEVEVNLVNAGRWPTALQHGVTTRAIPPVIALLGVDTTDVIHGQRRHLINSIEGRNGHHRLRWTVRGETGATLRLVVTPPHGQFFTEEVTLP